MCLFWHMHTYAWQQLFMCLYSVITDEYILVMRLEWHSIHVTIEESITGSLQEHHHNSAFVNKINNNYDTSFLEYRSSVGIVPWGEEESSRIVFFRVHNLCIRDSSRVVDNSAA